MGIFGNSSPFDQDVERATNENSTSEEWGLILEICDRAGASPTAARDCLRAVMRRLAHPDPHVQVHAATLLDACISNCGRLFHLEVASREFETEFRRLISRAQPAVASRLRGLLRKWSENEFRADPQLDLIPALARSLKDAPDAGPAPVPTAQDATAAAAAAQREQEELARAIALSLRETGGAANNPGSAAGTGAPGLYPRVEEAPPPQPAKKVRALYDFEAAEDNELTFLAGEIVHVTDSSDPNWWKGHNERGEGLFPANFVTADLTEPQTNRERGGKSVQFAENVSGGVAAGGGGVEEEVVEIDEAAMDAALALLHDADVEARGDESSLLALEARVVRMGPLVDGALERADTRHARLTALSAELVRALNLYHELMRPSAQPPPPPPGPYLPQGFVAHPQPPRC